MNKTNIRRVALALLTQELAKSKRHIGYNQGAWKSTNRTDKTGHNCGTTACIAGTAVAVLDPASFRARNAAIESKAKKLFGISDKEANYLFSGCPVGNHDPDDKQAAMVLFHLAETGKVNWNVTQ